MSKYKITGIIYIQTDSERESERDSDTDRDRQIERQTDRDREAESGEEKRILYYARIKINARVGLFFYFIFYFLYRSVPDDKHSNTQYIKQEYKYIMAK